jgi:hypothetical protein
VAYRVSLAELDGQFFGTKGEIGELKVEKLLLDKQGIVCNASTTSVADEERGKFWISGLTSKGKVVHFFKSEEVLVSCRLFLTVPARKHFMRSNLSIFIGIMECELPKDDDADTMAEELD